MKIRNLRALLIIAVAVCASSFINTSSTIAQKEPSRCILTIGDSIGASGEGWVTQLARLRKDDQIINTCLSGNTIGFDNLGSESLNTLKNIGTYINTAKDSSESGNIDDVVILLGTNDFKAIFSEQLGLVIPNLSILIDSIRLMTSLQDEKARIYLVTPPPFGPESMLAPKYTGAGDRLLRIIPGYLNLAYEKDCYFIDINSELLPSIYRLTEDGVHLNKTGSRMIATRISTFLDAFNIVAGDDTRSIERDPGMKEVDIQSTLDQTVQKAFYHRTSSVKDMPLLVILHTWSGDYTQHDPLAEEIIAHDWNYVFPDFRGANNTPMACGSSFAIQDIDDAIQFAIDQGCVDIDNIHIIGGSGGGYATLLMYMKSKFRIKTFSAWVPISDLEAWYYESSGRKNKYANDILEATGSGSGKLNIAEARGRSPIYMEVPSVLRKDAVLLLFAGIHDGYTGSVPVTHTLKIYNKVIEDLGATDDEAFIDDNTMLDLVGRRYVPRQTGAYIGDRPVLFQRAYQSVKLTIFEGGHEMLPEVALKIVAIGQDF